MAKISKKLPTELTPDYWKSNTDLKARINTKANQKILENLKEIPKRLKKISESYNSVDWNKFKAKDLCTRQNGVFLPAHVDAHQQAMELEMWQNVVPIQKTCSTLEKVATLRAKEIKSSLIKKKNRLACEAIAQAAKDYNTQLGKYKEEASKDFQNIKSRLEKKLTIAKKALTNGMKAVKKEAKKVLSNPTVQSYGGGEAGAGFYQSTRTVGTTLPLLKNSYPDLKAFIPKWKEICNAGFLPQEDKQVPDKVKKVQKLLKELEAIIK